MNPLSDIAVAVSLPAILIPLGICLVARIGWRRMRILATDVQFAPGPVRIGGYALTAVALAGAMLLLPRAALASDYCVARSGCDPNLSYPASGLQSALDAAGATPAFDRVLIGAGRYSFATYNAPNGGPIEIAGAGADQTVFDSGFGGLDAFANHVSVHDLGFDLTAGLAFGLETNGDVSNIDITSRSPSSNATGIVVGEGASIDHASIVLPSGEGLDIRGGATVVDSTIEIGSDGATSRGTALTAPQIANPVDLRRLRVRATNPLYVGVGTVRIADSLLDLGDASYATGILAYDWVNGPAVQVMADRVTIVGHKDVADMQTGVESTSDGIGATLGVTLVNSIIANVRYSTIRQASAGLSNVALHHSLVEPGETVIDQNTGAGFGGIEDDVVVTADPRFADPAAGDYRPRFDSPLVDAAAPATLALSATDLAGATRLVDGNGDGTLAADLGAFEYQRARPVVTGADAGSLTPVVGQPVDFAGSATDADPGEQGAQTWTFDDGSTSQGATATHAFALGRHTATFTVTDPTGQSASRTISLEVGTQPQVQLQSESIARAASASAPLKLSALTLAPSRFRVAAFLPGKARGARGGTTIRVRTSAATALTLRLVGKHARTAGLLHVSAHAGLNAIRFGGRLTRHSSLRPGSYTLTVTAGTATPLVARLTILR